MTPGPQDPHEAPPPAPLPALVADGEPGPAVGSELQPAVSMPLSVNAEAERIAHALGEAPGDESRDQFCRLGRELGVEGLRKLYARTLEVEASGGMMVETNERRRTPGGVFLRLARDLLDDEAFERVFLRPRGPRPGKRWWRKKSKKATQEGATRPSAGPDTPTEQPALPLVLVDQLSPQERASMTVPGKMELTLKIDRLPSKVLTDKNGWKVFFVACGPQEIEIKLRPKMFNKLSDAAAKWPSWVASISGQMGAPSANGFELLEPNVQVFERKVKSPDTKVKEPEK